MRHYEKSKYYFGKSTETLKNRRTDFYLQAYQNIYANKGAMTPGVDGMKLDGFGDTRTNKLIESLRDHSYQPTSVKRVYRAKKNGKKRPLGISFSDDKLVQEIIRMILEYIYLTPSEMIFKYNEQIRGLYNYYRIANNASVINKFFYVMEYSLYKTIAAKFKITMTEAKKKYTKNKVFSAPYETKNGIKYAVLHNTGFAREKMPLHDNVDITPEFTTKYKL